MSRLSTGHSSTTRPFDGWVEGCIPLWSPLWEGRLLLFAGGGDGSIGTAGACGHGRLPAPVCPGQPPSVPPRRPAFLHELPRPRRRGGTHRCQRLTGVAPGRQAPREPGRQAPRGPGRQAPRGPGRQAPRGPGRQAPRGPHSRTLCPAPGHEGPASPAGRRVFTGRARAGKGQSENVGQTLTEGSS